MRRRSPNGAVMKPSSNRLLNDPVASIESPIRERRSTSAALSEGRLSVFQSMSGSGWSGPRNTDACRASTTTMLKDIGVSRCDVEREIRFGGHGETRTDNPHRLFSHDLYFRARQARTQAMSDALESVFRKCLKVCPAPVADTRRRSASPLGGPASGARRITQRLGAPHRGWRQVIPRRPARRPQARSGSRSESPCATPLKS